jgi:hypothetical protein
MFVTGHSSRTYVEEAFGRGAAGYVYHYTPVCGRARGHIGTPVEKEESDLA